MAHENCTAAHIHWMENTGVQKLSYPCLKIEDATVTAENGASKDVTMKLSSMVVDELGSVDYEQVLVFDTAKMNELTDGDIAFGFVKKLHIFFSMNVTEELVDGVGKSKFDEFQAILDGFQLQFNEQTAKNEANQEKFDAFQATMDGFQVQFDEQTTKNEANQAQFDAFQAQFDAFQAIMDDIEQTEIVALKQKDFDQQVQIEGLLKVVFDLQQEVIQLQESTRSFNRGDFNDDGEMIDNGPTGLGDSDPMDM
jgi:IMP cyclohydrolase